LEDNLWSYHVSKHTEKIKSESIYPEDCDYQPDYVHHDLVEADSFTDSSEPEKAETVCVSSKIIDYIKDEPEYRNRITDYDINKSYYYFSNSFGFHLQRLLLKF